MEMRIWLFACVLCFFFGVGRSRPLYKVPVYWKQLNASVNSYREGRRLHDYLSLFPTYGDSKGLGLIIRFALTHSYFYSLVYVGNPPQRQTVILDTGSSILSFPCSTFVLLIPFPS